MFSSSDELDGLLFWFWDFYVFAWPFVWRRGDSFIWSEDLQMDVSSFSCWAFWFSRFRLAMRSIRFWVEPLSAMYVYWLILVFILFWLIPWEDPGSNYNYFVVVGAGPWLSWLILAYEPFGKFYEFYYVLVFSTLISIPALRSFSIVTIFI